MLDELTKPTVGELADAISEIVDEAMAYRDRQAKRPKQNKPLEFRVMDVQTLLETDTDTVVSRDWVSDPVYHSLKRGAHSIAEIVEREFGTEKLRMLADDIAERGTGWHRRMSFMDSAFNGVGSWTS